MVERGREIAKRSTGMNAPLPNIAGREALIEARRRSSLRLIGLFWLFALGVLFARGGLVDIDPFSVTAPRRVLIAGLGALMCLGMSFVLGRLSARSFVERALVGLIGAFIMSFVLTLCATMINRIVLAGPNPKPFEAAEIGQWTIVWMGYMLAWTGTHLALTYHWEVQEEQLRNAAMRDLAQEARIAALRYQVNPHFLFNALNAISGLVLEQRNAEAEAMLLNLSEFLRSALATDRGGTIGLEEELTLQRLYLDLEEARFAERMKVSIEVPDTLAAARVPTLILQPLVENAVRHGVDRSERTTTIRIAAASDGIRLLIVVEDDGSGEGPDRGGTGLGLANVRERLQAHFGESGRLTTGKRERGGFRAEIEMPLAVVA
jgi:signal transduction histidine kinase